MLMKNLDVMPWDVSQSGRRKQVNIFSFYIINLNKNICIYLELWTKV